MTVLLDTGKMRQVVSLSAPGGVSPDGDGGWIQVLSPLSPPTWRCGIEGVGATSTERAFADTVIAIATHVFRGRFHAGITTQTRLSWTDRAGVAHAANAIGVVDTEGAGVETVVLAAEIKP